MVPLLPSDFYFDAREWKREFGSGGIKWFVNCEYLLRAKY
jgi:hypothetical protein